MVPALMAVGGFLVKPALDYAHALIQNGIDPMILKDRYSKAQPWKTALPSPGDLFNAYITKDITPEAFKWGMNFNNIPIFGQLDGDGHKIGGVLWDGVLNSKYAALSYEQLFMARYQGIITDDEFFKLAEKYPMRTGHYIILKQLLEPSFDLTINLAKYYRGWDSPAYTKKLIRKIYACDDEEADRVLKSTQYIPPPSDLLRFAVKDVFTKNVELQKELDSEYEDTIDILPWAKAQGILDKTELKGLPEDALKDVLKMYWRAHWNLISPTQGYEGFHRLRANRLDRFRKLIPDIKEFGWDQLKQLLKMSDYLPSQRQVLAAISSKQLGRIDLRRLFNDGTMGKDELREQFYDLGYVETDANYLIDWSVKQKEEKEKKEKEKKDAKNYGRLVSEIYMAYEVGAIGRLPALTEIVAYGVDPEQANGNLMAIDIRINRNRVKALVNMVKTEFFLGLYDGQEAFIELKLGGVQELRAQSYIILWQRQLSKPRRIASTTTIIDWLKRGIISFIDAKNRLSRLGFSNEDTLLYLESANMDIQKQIALEEAKRAKTQQQQADEVKRLEKEMRAARKAQIAELKSYSSIAQMGKWIQDGKLSLPEAIERMTFMEIPTIDQQRYIATWAEGMQGE